MNSIHSFLFMSKPSQSEQEGLVEALGVEPDEVFEVGYNLIKFFEVLYRIDERLKKEKYASHISNKKLPKT